MADKMMRMAGRDESGRARAIKTDEQGNLGVRIVEGSAFIQPSPSKDNYPSSMPLESSMINSNGVRLGHMTDDGVLYGAKAGDTRIWKSNDLGETWEAIIAQTQPSQIVKQVRKMDTGKILAITLSGKVYLSDENEDNFTRVFDTATPRTDSFGVDVFDNKVLIAGYGSPGKDNYNKCWISTDYGETFKEILQHPDPTISHFHDIRYDPYENIIWASNGDYNQKDNIFYSNDLGRTWETTYGIEDLNVRITAIIPMPKCVLFVSDTQNEMFVWRYDRNPKGTQGHQVIPYRAWYFRREIDKNSDFVGTIPAITYGANASAFFGWHCYTATSGAIPGTIFGTTDGYTFVPIWSSDEMMVADHANFVEGGVMGVFGPDKNGMITARYAQGTPNEMIENVVRIKFPGWG